MAQTVKLKNSRGELTIIDDEFGVVGTGRAHVSKAEPGYVTLTLHYNVPEYDLKANRIRMSEFQVIRIPINWTTELE